MGKRIELGDGLTKPAARLTRQHMRLRLGGNGCRRQPTVAHQRSPTNGRPPTVAHQRSPTNGRQPTESAAADSNASGVACHAIECLGRRLSCHGPKQAPNGESWLAQQVGEGLQNMAHAHATCHIGWGGAMGRTPPREAREWPWWWGGRRRRARWKARGRVMSQESEEAERVCSARVHA